MPRLFHVSDLHFGRADHAALDWFAAAVRAEKPDAVVMTGDVTMRSRREEWAEAAAWLKALGVPVTIEPGNHDIPLYNLPVRLLAPYRQYRRLERAIERPLDLPGIWLVPLKTTARWQWRNWSKGRVSRSGLVAALDRLKRTPAGHVAIVACHHPLVDAATDSQARTEGGAEALEALAAAGADVVLSGHVHDAFDVAHATAAGPVRLIGAGTLSERIRATQPSFNLLSIDGGRIDLAVRTMGKHAAQ